MICSGDQHVMGAQIAIYPMQDNFVDVILGAVRATSQEGLAVRTTDLSTCVQGPVERVWAYAEELFVRAAAAGGHVTASLILSCGCPGETLEESRDFTPEPAPLPDGSFPVACAWSLYPLGRTDYMDVIYRSISQSKEVPGVTASPRHYSSRLDGPATAIFATLRQAFDAVRAEVSHTVIHATLSKGSPSKCGAEINVQAK